MLQIRSSSICMSRNRKTETLSTQSLLMFDIRMSILTLLLLTIRSLVLVMLGTRLLSLHHPVSHSTLSPYADSSPLRWVPPLLCHQQNDGVAGVGGGAVMGVEGAEKGPQHTVLWGAGAEAKRCGRMGAYSKPLGSVQQEVQDSVADGWGKSQIWLFWQRSVG